MLEHVIDNKKIINVDGVELIDLTPSIFDINSNFSALFNVYRVPESMRMRIDLISIAAYGTDKYADIILKYNGISNPFTINTDDILYIPTIDTVENDLSVPEVKSNVAENIRNYHRYIDKSKAPSTIGSQQNNKTIAKNTEYTEANIAGPDETAITLRNGRIYFGKNCNPECSVEGMTASDFAINKIENELL